MFALLAVSVFLLGFVGGGRVGGQDLGDQDFGVGVWKLYQSSRF